LTRPFDKHLDSAEFDALVSAAPDQPFKSALPTEEALNEARLHMDGCDECNRKVQMHWQVQGEIVGLATSRMARTKAACPQDIDWLNVAAGLLPEEETKNLMLHAAQCGECGSSLRVAADLLSDEATPEEETLLHSLGSAHPRRQWELVRKLQNATEGTPLERHRRRRWMDIGLLPRVVFAVGSLTVAVAAIWLSFKTFRQPDAEQLLAQAYSEQRTLELRIPGAKHAAMHVELGPEQSHSERPPALLRAETLIAENLSANPDDPHWLYTKGEADLLEGNFESARKNLDEAQRRTPADENVQIALATAHFSLGDYSEALNLLREVTHKHPTNASAWFNLAITCAKLHLFTEALSAWNSYLALDSGSPWAAEAKRRKYEVEQILKDSQTHQGRALYAPAELADLTDSQREVVDERIESYVNVAVSAWLPRIARNRSGNTVEREAAESIAQIAADKHQDSWLSDILGGLNGSVAARGSASLAEAVTDSQAGDYSKARAAARRAAVDFRNIGLTPGLLRARFESIYADHLSQKGETCYSEAGVLLQQLHGKSYAWLEAQTELERAICANMTGRMKEAKLDVDHALSLAWRHKYDVLSLRATSLAAVLEWTTGNFRRATKLANDGLDQYWSRAYPAMTGYNLYAVLDSVAQDSQQWFSQVSTGREALHLIASDPDHSLQAVMRQTLANAALSSGEMEIADENLREATHQLALAAPGEATVTLKAVTQVGLARMEYLEGNSGSASTLLREIEPFLADTSNRFVLLDFYLVKGDVFAAAGQRGEARIAFVRAIGLCEKGLKSITSERERLVWARLYDRSYRAMVELALQDDPTEAFQWWERYKNAPVENIERARVESSLAEFDLSNIHGTLHHGRSLLSYALPNDAVILSYILSNKGAGAWLYGSKGIEYQKLSVSPQDLDNLAKSFVEHCRTRTSNQQSLRFESRRLYDILIGPFISSIGHSKTMIVEADGILDGIPFEALIDGHGDFLGDDYNISLSPGLLYLSRTRPQIQSVDNAEALVIGNPSLGALSRLKLNPIPRADDEARQIARLLRRSRLLTGPEATASAILQGLPGVDIFHFSGHALLLDNGSGLVIAGEANDRPPALLDAVQFEKSPLKRTSLVVLSACSTAGSDEETLSEEKSLARTFIKSGVAQVIASRWSVDSDATTDLMETFYAHLLAGDSVTTALRRAKLAIRTRKEFSHPYYWAAFSVFGAA
jgi:CHAT domain-containing protein/cytochrome c-type biogenesis protein CcmH/NrfG